MFVSSPIVNNLEHLRHPDKCQVIKGLVINNRISNAAALPNITNIFQMHF